MGKVTIKNDDGRTEEFDLSQVLLIQCNRGEPRELQAMKETHRVLAALDGEEAQRVLSWLCEMFPSGTA